MKKYCQALKESNNFKISENKPFGQGMITGSVLVSAILLGIYAFVHYPFSFINKKHSWIHS